MTIQRSPDDPRSPYVMIHRDIINDRSISPQTRWFVIYCDSLENNFHLSESELAENTGLEVEQIRFMIEEAISAGLMVRKKAVINEQK